MKILFLSYWFPFPANNGSKIRIKNLLNWLAQHHDVTLLSFADQSGVNPEAPEVAAVSSKVRVIPWREFDPNTWRARLAILNPKPRSVVDTYSPEMAQAITETLQEEKYDLVIASQLQMAAYYQYFRDVPTLFEEMEIGLFHDQAFSSDGKIRFRHALTWFKLRMYLSRLLNSFQAITVVSQKERQLLVRKFPDHKKRIDVIPNCLNMDEYKTIKPDKRTNTLIFTGSFKYRANYDAMFWFVRDVFPLVLKRVPDVQLIITGDHADLSLPPARNITLAGHVEDVKSLIASCSVSIAPLLNGGGTRLKILEAMALRTPVVATSKGAEGLDVVNQVHLLVADTSASFAECVLDLLGNADLSLRLVENAYTLVQERYNWGMMLSNYFSIITTIAR